MTGPTRYIAAGTQYAFLGFVDSTFNYLLGSTTSAPSAAATSPMLRLLGIQTASPGIQQSEDVSVPGDDTVLGQISFPPDTLPSFVAELGSEDLDINALLQGTSVVTLGGIKTGVLQPNNPENPDACLIIQGKAKSKDDSTGGAKAWSGMIIPRATVQPLGRETFEGRSAAVNRLQITTQTATHAPWGVTITDSNYGTSGAPIIEISSDNPVVMEATTGAVTTWTLTYTPVSQAKVVIHSNTAPLVAGADFTLAGKVVTFAPALAAGARVVGLYEFQP
jgi:hypothetical protein